MIYRASSFKRPSRTLAGIIRRFISLLIKIVKTRLDLMSIELQEEISRLIKSVVIAGIALMSVAYGILITLTLVIYLTPSHYRIAVMSGIAIALFLIASLLLSNLRKNLSGSRMFSESRKQLTQDLNMLEGRNHE